MTTFDLTLTVQKAAEAVSIKLPTSANIIDRLFTLESFIEAFAEQALPGVRLSSQDMQILLKYLQRDRRMVVLDGDVSLFEPGSADRS